MGTNNFGELGVGSTTFVNRTFVPIPSLPADTMSVHSVTTTIFNGFSIALTTSGGMYIAGQDFTTTFVRSNGLINDELVRQVYPIAQNAGRGIICLTNGNNLVCSR